MAGTGMLISGALGLGEAAVGLFNSGKADKKAKELAATRPKLGPSQLLKDQLSLAESDLSTGMSAEAKTAYEEGMDKDLSTSLGAITRMGGSPNDVGSVFANSATGRQRLAIMKDNMRLSKINNLVRAQDANEEERQKEFEFNQWMPWSDAAQANAQKKANDQSEIFGGISTAASGAMRFGQEQESNKLFANYFAPKNNQTNPESSDTPLPRANPSNVNRADTSGAYSAPSSSYLDGLLDDNIIY